MHKKLISLTIFIFGLLISPTVYAQNDQIPVWNCLSAKRNGIDKVMLTNSELSKHGTVYIVDCVGTPEGSYCTTGKPENDTKLKIGYSDAEIAFSVDNEAILKEKNVSTITATVDFAKSPLHTFYYVYFENVSQAKTIKYSAINFVNNSCDNTILINPDRRFFDLSTLEPIEGIRVTLTDTNGTAVVSPQMTNKDGGFYYLSENSSLQYKIEAPQTYAYANQVDQNSLKQYRANVETYSQNIYTRDDVALIPRGAQAINPPTEAFYTVDRFDTFTRIQGRVSHAFATVVFAQADIELTRVKSDKFGNYKVRIENTKIDNEKGLQLSYIKANFFDVNVAKVQGISINAGVEIVPISNKIFGYTYDNGGNIIPEANIEVKLKASDKVYYATKSDKNGYFILNADRLPKLEYHLNIYASEDSITKYHYVDRDVQAKLVKSLSDKANQDFRLVLLKELKDKTSYAQGNNIFDNINPVKIAAKNEATNYQKAVTSYFISAINNGPQTSQIFGKDINTFTKNDFISRVASDISSQLGVKDTEFSNNFATYYAGLAYDSEFKDLIKTNKDAFDQKITTRVAFDIFASGKNLSYQRLQPDINFVTFAADTSLSKILKITNDKEKVVKFSDKYFEIKVVDAVGNALMQNLQNNRNLGKALAEQGKSVATSIISDYINKQIPKDKVASGLLTGIVGNLINGQDVGQSLTNAAKAVAINEGKKLLISTLTNPLIDKVTGNVIKGSERFLSGDVAGPIAGFLFSAIQSGDIGQAAKSAVMKVVQDQIQRVVTNFLKAALKGISGLGNFFAGPIGAIILSLLIDLLTQMLSKSSAGGGGSGGANLMSR